MIWSADEAAEAARCWGFWAGEVKQVEGDYLMVVDANLSALKTDPKVEQTTIHYENFSRTERG